MEAKINVKSVSGKKNKITTINISYTKDEISVRELIEETVKYCVEKYNERVENGEVLKALLPQEIEDMATQGKIAFETIYNDKTADVKTATYNAISSFEDGIVAIFADKLRIEKLEETIKLSEIESITFIKLVMLAGRMW